MNLLLVVLTEVLSIIFAADFDCSPGISDYAAFCDQLTFLMHYAFSEKCSELLCKGNFLLSLLFALETFLAVGVHYPRLSSLVPFLARVHTVLESHELGSLFRYVPLRTEPIYSTELMQLFTNYFGLHCLVHVRHSLEDDQFTCGYIFKSHYQLYSGPFLSTPEQGLMCTIPIYDDQQYVSIVIVSANSESLFLEFFAW